MSSATAQWVRLADEIAAGEAYLREHVEGGFTARLSVTLPATCGPEAVEHHLEHFAVEFRNWILGAAAEQPAP